METVNSRLLFKKIANFKGKLLENYKQMECEIFKILLKYVSDHLSVLLTIFAYQEVRNVRFSKNLAGFVKSLFRFGLLLYCQRNKPLLFIAITLESIFCFKHNFQKNFTPQSYAEMFDFCEIDRFIQVSVCTLMIQI